MASAQQRGARFIGLYRDAAGKQRSAGTYATEEEALARARVAEIDARPPKVVEVYARETRGRVTVAGYAPGWLDGLRKEHNTRLAYSLSMKHIVKDIGGIPIADVQTSDIVRIIRSMEKLGRADSTIRHAVTVAKQMFKSAIKAGLRADNPCDDEDAHVKVRDQREMMIVTREQAKAIEDALPERHKLLVRALFDTGCRWGEIIAVRGTDVEQRGTGHVLKVRRTVGETTGVGIYVRNYGKSAKTKRDINIPDDLAIDLLEFGSALCFTNTRGNYPQRSDFGRWTWKPAVKAAGVPGLRVHDTRHSHASWLANDPRVPLAAVRDRLGHSSIAITSRYIHVMPGDDPCLAALAEAA